MPKTVIYYGPTSKRSKLIAEAMRKGAGALGIAVDFLPSTSYRGIPEHDQAIFYGLGDGLKRVFAQYRKHRRCIYIDLGYWGRRKRTRWDGYHKLICNSRHPDAYMQNIKHPDDRFRQHGLEIMPWRRKPRHILLAGMSGKAAAAEGFAPEEWERKAIRTLRGLTDRPIIYRPKPNWPQARHIEGSIKDCKTPLGLALNNCHCVVSHHSNVGVDALLAGVPVISVEGAASLLGSRHLVDIENPPMPEGREQWAADLAYCQYTLHEMENGKAMRYLLDEGLLL